MARNATPGSHYADACGAVFAPSASARAHLLGEVDETVRHKGPVALGMDFRRRQIIVPTLRVDGNPFTLAAAPFLAEVPAERLPVFVA